ncbi:AAA family ATPase [Oceanobacter sp. 4_MG-2023]|uniref:AAA family ATPase n=2 Tax=Gammaproteobacteria TaxID=1236 RepID=UPI00273663C0|nr:AAA family ATPase [Oceanobacter sp. 4_MG-2023]MDP2547570.1 AAA family ATPase [Oceanobacter sp. 4_MG-2023]
MVFINDRLQSQQRQSHTSDATASERPALYSRFAFEPAQLQQQLERHLVGQQQIIHSLCRQLDVLKAGLSDDRRPLLTALFLGDTGVGKTEMVRRIAEALHGDANHFCRIDMNTLSQSHYSAAITGAPPGYVGSKDNLTLLNEELIKGSNSRPGIVLFDEIEKASPDVVRSLMNILDNGELTLASGQKALNFRNTLVFMTSNLGSRAWQRHPLRPWLPPAWQARLKHRLQQRALDNHFDAEFLNRIHCIERFASLGSEQLPQVVTTLLNELNQRLKRHQLTLLLDDACLFWLSRGDFDQHYGARAIQRLFQRQVVVPLASYLLTLPSCAHPRQLRALLRNDALTFSAGPMPSAAADPATHASAPSPSNTREDGPVAVDPHVFSKAVLAHQGANHD